ncbi:hypothetical protein KL864_26615, partial [Mycolicibacterium goodii]|uniref:hypothetical protein n=1 Tax=Mycolicibacterium goodii TaxID=134601 RepID=UPI001BDD8101
LPEPARQRRLMIGPSDIQIILGKVRPLSRPLTEAHPQVLIIARGGAPGLPAGHSITAVITSALGGNAGGLTLWITFMALASLVTTSSWVMRWSPCCWSFRK